MHHVRRPSSHGIPLAEAVRVWVRVAALSFGGPAGQIAVMHRILVEEKRWISERRFLHALNFCMLLPGPEAQQLATYIGWLLHRTAGGLIAGTLFVLPGFLSILGLSLLYVVFADTSFLTALFFGLKAAVLAVVLQALLRIGTRALRHRVHVAIAATAFIAIFFLTMPFPLIVVAAGLLGIAGSRLAPDVFRVASHPGGDGADGEDIAIADGAAAPALPSARRAIGISALGLSLWAAPVLALAVALGADHVLVAESVFFSKAAVVTFGGAYSVLAYVAQQAVETYQWLQPGEMLDGIGMAETTPGPLIQVVQFVGFMGAYRHADPFDPLLAGVLGSIVTTWVTFVPCFLWVFLGAPYVERARENVVIGGALAAVTAAVVGVMANLALWFAFHVAFAEVAEVYRFGVRWLVPDLASASHASIAIAVGAAYVLFRRAWGVIPTLAASTGIGFLYALATAP